MPGSSEHPDGASGVAVGVAGPVGAAPADPADPAAPGARLSAQLADIDTDMESQRRLSTSSDASSSESANAQKGDPNMEYIPTRMTKVTTPKPAANPLQFVKVGPCDLFKSAQETLKKVEEVKKMKREVRDEAEEWQSNLDNWKCSRRKRVEHIIDRVVEVKKLELEEHERNRRKAKTFSEMMEERNSRGRKMSLLVHKDDDSNDLSDLGIGTSSDKSSVSEDYGNDDNHSVGDVEDSVKSHFIDQNGNTKSGCKGTNGINGGHDDDTSTSATVSSPEPEEYTYDRAIQGYVNFTETRVKSRTSSQISRTKRDAELVNGISSKGQNGISPKSPPISPAKPRKECAKVEEEISDLERIQSRKYSGSSSDLNNSEKKVIIPKVDILKRKELFEKTGEASELTKIAPRAAGELANSKSIRDRVSNLERQKSEENADRSKQVKRLSGEISVKDRLSLLEKQKSTEGLNKSPSGNKLNGRLSTSDLNSSSRSIKERLSSLEQSTTTESKDRSNKVSSDVSSTSIKSRLSELGTPKDSPKKLTADRDPTFHDKLANFRSSEADITSPEASKKIDSDLIDSSARSLSPDDIYHSKRHFHRSLDSLDVDTSSQISNEAFERVQSLEDLDSCGPSRNYPASASSNENLVFSSQSGDTDREDSGIHTADVSCSVSQADDPADIGDMNLPSCTSQLENETSLILDSENHSEHAPPMIVSQLEKIAICESSLPAEENIVNGTQASQLEVINSKCPSSAVVSLKTSLQSGVLVDLTSYPDSQFNPASNTQNTSRSSNLSFLPCIPEVSHSTPPVVVVIDTDPITLTSNADVTSFPPITSSHDSEINFSHIPPTDTEVVGEDSMSDSTECGETIKELLASQTGEDDLETETHTLVEDFETLSAADVHKTVPEECEAPVSLGAFTVLEEALHIPLEEPDSTNVVKEDVAGLLTAEVSVDTDLGCYEDKGPKPFSSKYSFKGSQSPTEHVMGPLTSVDNDMDVSSFLDQALFEEDLKTTPSTFRNPKNEELPEANIFKSSNVSEQHILYSIGTHEVLPSGAVEIMPSGIPLAFPLDTPSTAEPPKEKPPPPPIEVSDDEEKNDFQKNLSGTNVNSVSSTTDLRRLDSTKRLKKEIRRKRSDFLGIEGPKDDSYLEPELKVAPPPDMTSFLQEERRLEQELYRQTQQSHYSESEQGSIQSEQLYHPTQPHYSESDQGSNQGESRDSGVELDSHGHSHAMHVDDSWGSKQPSSSPGDQSSEAHSRQNSEPFGNASTASEEDEIVKKEREIIEILEKEEQWRYGTNTVLSPSDHHQVGEKLAAKLRELEQEKMRLEWERAEEAQRAAAEQATRQEEQRLFRIKEQQLRQQESIVDRLPGEVMPDCDRDLTPEDLREERERLRREHAELERQRELLAANQADLRLEHRQCWDSSSLATAAHLSLQDVSGSPLGGGHNPLSAPSNNAPLNYRLSLPDLQQPESTHSIAPRTVPHHRRPPPPIPPAKPLAALSQERQVHSGSSRNGHSQSSADALPLALDPQHHRHNSLGIPTAPTASPPTISPGSQQMSRQTLHALSAAPRSKIIATDTWVQAKRKPESQRSNNRDHYQHWLIQEAEHRRITEQQQRNAVSRKSLPAQTQLQQSQSKIIPAAPAPSQQPQLPSQQWQYQNHQHQHPHHQLSHQHSHQQHPPQHPSQGAPPVPPPPRQEKPLPDAIIQTLTQRVQNRVSLNENNRRIEGSPVRENRPVNQVVGNNINNNINSANVNHGTGSYAANSQEKMLSVSGKKKCSHCNEELGRGAAMIIESLRLFYHMDCFKCCVCHVQLGDGLMGTDVRVRNHKLHCHNCYSSDDGVKFSCV